MSAKGYVYVLTNKCFDGSFKSLVKIGQAKDVDKRVATLNTAVPKQFHVYATLYSSKYKQIETAIHQKLRDKSAIKDLQGERKIKAENGEFYLITPAQAIKVIKDVTILVDDNDKELVIYGPEKKTQAKPKTIASQDEKFSEELKREARRGPFSFTACGIKPGSVIQFSKNKKIEAIVVDDRRVQHEDETMSLSALAKKLLHLEYDVQGPIYFEYRGEILDDLRSRMEKK